MSLNISLATLLLASLAGGPLSAPVPTDARPGLLDAQLTINEVPTRVREWILDLDLHDSAIFYRAYLGDRRVELAASAGLLMAAPHEGKFVTVELARIDRHRTRVRVSEAALASASRAPLALPLPVDARVLGRLSEIRDQGKVHTLLARTESGAQATGGSLRRSFERAGLRLLYQQPLRDPAASGEVLNFIRGAHRVQVVLTQDHGRTWIMAMDWEGGL